MSLPISSPPQNAICSGAWKITGSLAALITAMTIWSAAASAQVIVVKSTVKGLKPGTLLENSARVSIPAGLSALVVLPSGTTRAISGPFNGRASDLTKGVKSNPGVFDAVKRYVATGGSNQKRVGAVRSLASPSFAKPQPFSWRDIPINSYGDICVEKNASLSLVRSGSNRAQTVKVIDLKTKLSIEVVFPKGATSQPWPDDLEVDPRTSYALVSGGRRPKELRMRVISPLPRREDTLQVLHGQRCTSQFRAFIRELQVASK